MKQIRYYKEYSEQKNIFEMMISFYTLWSLENHDHGLILFDITFDYPIAKCEQNIFNLQKITLNRWQ